MIVFLAVVSFCFFSYDVYVIVMVVGDGSLGGKNRDGGVSDYS